MLWGLLALIALLVFGYPALEEWRERRLAERLERLRERMRYDNTGVAGVAATMMDAATAEARADTERIRRMVGRGGR